MTQPNQPDPGAEAAEGGDPELLKRLTETTGKDVEQAAKAVNHYSEDDDAADKRMSRAQHRRSLSKIRRWFFWFLFVAICSVITVSATGYLYLVWLYVGTLVWGTEVHNPAALKAFIDNVLWALLVIFATLFLEGAFRDRER